MPAEPEPGTKHSFHLYTVLVDAERCGLASDPFLEATTAQGIGVGVHYFAIPEHPYYRERFGFVTPGPSAPTSAPGTRQSPCRTGYSPGEDLDWEIGVWVSFEIWLRQALTGEFRPC